MALRLILLSHTPRLKTAASSPLYLLSICSCLSSVIRSGHRDNYKFMACCFEWNRRPLLTRTGRIYKCPSAHSLSPSVKFLSHFEISHGWERDCLVSLCSLNSRVGFILYFLPTLGSSEHEDIETVLEVNARTEKYITQEYERSLQTNRLNETAHLTHLQVPNY